MGHERFDRTVYASVSDFTGALAKWLVKQSPYTVPINLSACVEKFDKKVRKVFSFDKNDITQIALLGLTETVYSVLEKIPEIASLNIPLSGHTGNIFVSRVSSGPENPDDNFIDIMAVAQNITCEFAQREDAEAWLDREKATV